KKTASEIAQANGDPRLQGKWASGCVPAADPGAMGFEKSEMSFTGTAIIATASPYLDAICTQGVGILLMAKGSYQLGAGSTADGPSTLDVHISEVTLIVTAAPAAAGLNQKSFCGKTDWTAIGGKD